MSAPLDVLEQIVLAGGDADDVLRAVVDELVRVPGIDRAAILFLENGELVIGPRSGTPHEARRLRVPIVFRGDPVGELAVDGTADPAFLERVAELVSPYVLLGWDTGGERWEP
jgi:hypothetical protein